MTIRKLFLDFNGAFLVTLARPGRLGNVSRAFEPVVRAVDREIYNLVEARVNHGLLTAGDKTGNLPLPNLIPASGTTLEREAASPRDFAATHRTNRVNNRIPAQNVGPCDGKRQIPAEGHGISGEMSLILGRRWIEPIPTIPP
ncbi:hypothetical protein VUR80DRAFT_10311 [Thermomyces stellatus]